MIDKKIVNMLKIWYASIIVLISFILLIIWWFKY